MKNGDSLNDYLQTAGGVASGVLGALNPKPAAAASTPQKTNWGLIAGIGGAVLGVILLLVFVTRK